MSAPTVRDKLAILADAATAKGVRLTADALDFLAEQPTSGGVRSTLGSRRALEDLRGRRRDQAIVKAMEGQPFFGTVRGQCITSLYDNDMAYATFGYPGSAWEKGGYITRGFQDLKWLPGPTKEASPPPFMG